MVILIIVLIIILLVIAFIRSLSYTSKISTAVLGKSMIENLYQTKEPVSLNYWAYGKKFYLEEWRDRPILGNPEQWECHIKLPPRIMFEVTDIFNGYHLNSEIRLLNDVKLTDVSNFLEADDAYDYINGSILDTKNPHLSSIIDKENNRLKTKDMALSLFTFEFFNYQKRDPSLSATIKGNIIAFPKDSVTLKLNHKLPTLFN